jgi:hypothetical protein
MATRLTVTVNTNGGSDGGSRNSECQQCADVLYRVAFMLQNLQASGTVTDRNGFSHSYTYTPTASA